MARRPDGLTARTEHISARFRASTAAELDRQRGDTPRSRHLEKLVLEEAKRNRPPVTPPPVVINPNAYVGGKGPR